MPSGGGGSFVAFATARGRFNSTVGLTSSATGGISSALTLDPSANNWSNVGAAVVSLDDHSQSGVAPGLYSVVVTGNGGGIQHQLPVGLTVQAAPQPVAIAAPSALQTNIGWIPLDMYDYAHSPSEVGAPFAASCPGATSVRSCYQAAFENFRLQHVTGVRFIFLLCRGFTDSASITDPNSINPLHGCGLRWDQVTSPNANATTDEDDRNPWIANLKAFLQDLHDKQIYNVTPTMVHGGDESGSVLATPGPSPNGLSCSGQPDKLWFVPGEPFGRMPCSATEMRCPTGQDCSTYCLAGYQNPFVGNDNQAGYYCSPSNPIFVGWQNLDNVAAAVIRTAHRVGEIIFEFDLEQELNPTSFPVQARYIYDNAHGNTGCNVQVGSLCYHDELKAVEPLMGADGRRVTWSAPDIQRQSSGFDCADVYGGFARLIHLDEITQIINGSYFGMPFRPGDASVYPNGTYGLTCGGFLCSDLNNNTGENDTPACTGNLMTRSPLYNPQPTIVDLHTYPCITDPGGNGRPAGGCFQDDALAETYGEAKNVFNALATYLTQTGNQSATVMVGETHTTANNGCTSDTCSPIPCTSTCSLHAPLDAAAETVRGFNDSSLAGRSVVFRPFLNLPGADNCYFPPGNQRLNSNNQGPFKPSQQE